jgi:hypothetical protein
MLPNDLAEAFKDVELSDNPEVNRANAESMVAQWLDSVTDLDKAAA